MVGQRKEAGWSLAVLFIIMSIVETCEDGMDNLSLDKRQLEKNVLAYTNFFGVLAQSPGARTLQWRLCVFCFPLSTKVNRKVSTFEAQGQSPYWKEEELARDCHPLGATNTRKGWHEDPEGPGSATRVCVRFFLHCGLYVASSTSEFKGGFIYLSSSMIQ